MTRELSDAAALARMPHKGNMRLIDRVVSVSERQIHCIATPHNDATYPLRIDGTLFSACLVELGAQACGDCGEWRGFWVASGRQKLARPDKAFLGWLRGRITR